MSKESYIREPTSCYHFVESYLNRQQIERVLNHYKDYISGALYILHDKDTYQVTEDFSVRKSELVERHNELKKEINLLEVSINSALSAYKTKTFQSAEEKYLYRQVEITQKKRYRTRLQKKYMQISDDIYALDESAKIAGCLKEPHYHILIKCYSAHTCSAVRKWFYRFRVTEIKKDDNGNDVELVVNSNNAIVDSVSSARDYLTHKNEPEDSGKYYYSTTDVIEFKNGWLCFNKSGRSSDDVLALLDAINNDTPIRDLIRDYGRDFVINRAKYNSVALAMLAEEERAKEIIDNENDIIRKLQKEPNNEHYYYHVLNQINVAHLVESVTSTILEEISGKK